MEPRAVGPHGNLAKVVNISISICETFVKKDVEQIGSSSAVSAPIFASKSSAFFEIYNTISIEFSELIVLAEFVQILLLRNECLVITN